MPSKKIQGQGDATEIKQRGLSFAFRIGLFVIQRPDFKQWGFNYFHFDLHAGSGYNEDAHCNGSPLTYLNEAKIAGCENYIAGFCDRDADAVKSLLQYPQLQDRRCSVFHGDNSELLAMVPDIIGYFRENRKHAIGSVLSDPNGAAVPIDALADLAESCPKIDVILHWNSTITKRLRYGNKPEQIVLEDVPGLIKKQHWLIREPATAHQFTILIGRNLRTSDYPAMGFYHLDSERGQEILERCSLSLREQAMRAQTDLLGEEDGAL
jgi:three-Cys-motif partner protein